MPSALEITRALYGAWRFVRLDRGAMQWFEVSVGGFWRSFFAFAIVAPGYAVLKHIEHAEVPLSAGAPRIVIVDGISYVLQIVAYPLAMVYLSRAIGRWDRYIGFIVALNWSVVLQMAVMVLAILLAASHAVPEAAGPRLVFAAWIAVLLYQWFVTLTALEVSGLIAAGAVALDLLIGGIVDAVSYGLLQGPAAP
ncbi:MAG: hypothetical protein ACE5JZ_08660 [Kiloniellales bacterium]